MKTIDVKCKSFSEAYAICSLLETKGIGAYAVGSTLCVEVISPERSKSEIECDEYERDLRAREIPEQ